MACGWIVTPCQCPVPCYTLRDCLGILQDIEIVVPIPPSPIGFVLTFAEYPGTCWEIIAQGFCLDPLDIVPLLAYEDCACCLPQPVPPPEPIVRYPYVLTKIFNRITVGECDINANQVFAEAVYDQVKKLKYGIATACVIDMEQAWLKKELSDLAMINNPELCNTCNTCNSCNQVPCCCQSCAPVVDPVCIFPVPLVCPPATDVTTDARFDCDPAEVIDVIESFS